MQRNSLIWQLFTSHLAIIFVALLTISLYGANTIKDFHLQQTAKDLEARAQIAAGDINTFLTRRDLAGLNEFCRTVGQLAATRITVIAINGEVLADSQESAGRMENHAGRPEITAALAGRIEPTVRFSATLGKPMMYVAIPLKNEETLHGVLRTSVAIATIDKTLDSIHRRILLVALGIALLAAGISWLTARRISRPLEQMRHGAERFAAGELDRQLHINGPEEITGLAAAMNRMAHDLDDRINTVVRQHNELEAVFASMVEGVLVFDRNGRLISLNRAAANLAHVQAEQVIGRNILEVVRNRDLLALMEKTLETAATVEKEIILPIAREERFFQVHGVRLQDAAGEIRGGMLVINDITHIRRLERVRRDFVANVSHELRTPITAIKGFVETLLDGAMDKPDEAARFLRIIAKKTDRLSDLITDLLTLSRLERDTENNAVTLQTTAILPVLQQAFETCRKQAAEKDIRITLNCPPQLQARINPTLLEQALLNLLDNAVKYSPPGREVSLAAESNSNGVIIRVADTGAGIGREHLGRLFERFYRGDASRGGPIEGSGLGLAIVKHISQAHGGDIQVQSTLGRGTTFSLRIPADADRHQPNTTLKNS